MKPNSLSLPKISLYKLALALMAAASLPRVASAQGEGTSASGAELVVSVIDSGFDLTHPDLEKHFLTNPAGEIQGFDFVNNSPKMGVGEHGTHVAGIVAGQAGEEIPPGVKLLPIRVMKESNLLITLLQSLLPSESLGPEESATLVKAIKYADEMGARMASCSFSFSNPDPAVRRAIEEAAHILFVCASSNQVKNIWTTAAPRYPANYDLPNVISVAATVDDKLAWYSNPAAAVGAPGSLRSTLPGNRYGVKSGTSMAAPYALNLLIHALANNSSLTNEDLKSLLPDLPGITPKEDMKRPNLLDSALQINKQNLVEYPGFYALTVILYALTAIQYAAEKHARKGREDIEKMKMV